MTTPNWDDYLSGPESTGYVTGDVAETWNEHAAQSDAALDAAQNAIEANDAALDDAAANLGTNPDAVNASLEEAVEQFNATNAAQWESLGMEPPHEY
jgi:hypothetical protein